MQPVNSRPAKAALSDRVAQLTHKVETLQTELAQSKAEALGAPVTDGASTAGRTLHAAIVSPITAIAAYCDILTMNRLQDESVHETIIEISKLAASMRAAFQKYLEECDAS